MGKTSQPKMHPSRAILAVLAGTLIVIGIVSITSDSYSPNSVATDGTETQLSTDSGGISTNGRQDLSIIGCAGFNCQKRYICIDKYRRCTDNWCTVNCNHGPSFCPRSYCLGQAPPPPPPPSGCDGVVNSGKVMDACGVCGGDGSSCAGCDGVANSHKVEDACGVCGGDGSSCAGCDGVANSGKLKDACGVCGGDGTSCAGCDGVANSGKVNDACGECAGDGTSCAGCDGMANSHKLKDACGVCDGDGKSCAGCDGVANSGKVTDACGVCGGDGSSCAGCDGVANSGKVMDACGVCAGDGSSCAGCDGVANSGKVKDACGVCGGDGKSCAGCDGVANSGKVKDACDVCGGDGSSCANSDDDAKCTWSEVLVPNMKCAFTTGVHGVSREHCQDKAEASGDAFYSWRATDVQTLKGGHTDGKEFTTDQCFTTKTCDNVLSSTWNDWRVFYCTPANVANNMCQPTSKGLSCCSSTCDTCGGPDCDAGGKGSECCPETIDKADKNCATNLPPCVFSPGGFPTKDVDYKDYAGKISPHSESEGQKADNSEPVGQSATTFGKYGSDKEIKTKMWLTRNRCEVSASFKEMRIRDFGPDGCKFAKDFKDKSASFYHHGQ